jgi:hypothetical protein
MDLVEVLDGSPLQQDLYSQSEPVFGKDDQLQVVGWSGKSGSNRYYILKCSKCSQDSELFGEGYFRSVKGSLVKCQVPCGCAKNPRWSQGQFSVLCSRKAEELDYTFLGFAGEWKGNSTKLKMLCEKHGDWSSGVIDRLINRGIGCPGCRVDAVRSACIKPDEVMIASFHESNAFHPDTLFWRSERMSGEGKAVYWHMSCPECGEDGESTSGDLQKGKRPCDCSKQRQTEAYINWVIDEYNNTVGIKFGIANDSKHRVKQQNSKSVYEISQHAVYTFPSIQSCKKAERECLQELECGVVLKRDMKDGYTETTWVYNLGKIVEIYKRNGGIKNDRN